jgi:hypothetical protein
VTLRLFGWELLMLLTLACVGAGPVALLRGNEGVGSRLAIAPGAGAALTIGLLTAVNFFVPLDGALWWAILPLALASLAMAFVLLRRRGELPRSLVPSWHLIAVGVVVFVVLGIANVPLHNRDSYGVMGWGVFDAPGYVSCTEGFTHHTNDVPVFGSGVQHSVDKGFESRDWGPDWNIADRFCWHLKWQHTGAETIPAAFSSSLGWQPWQALSPFMAVLIAIAALGGFALAAGLSGSLLAAAAAGLATGGPALFQIYMDGAGGLLGGTALLAPLLAVGSVLVLRPTVAKLVVTALLCAGLQATYPEMLLLPLLAFGLAVVVRGVAAWWDGSLHRGHVLTAIKYGAGFIVLMLLFAPRSSLWTLDYYATSINNTATGNQLDYNMRAQFITGWLTQTREFYSFAFAQPADLVFVLQGLLLPEILLGLAIAAGVRNWRVLLPVAFIAVAIVQALAVNHKYSCPYCVQRTMLTTVPVIAALTMSGLIWGLRRPGVLVKALAGGAAVALGLSGLHALRTLHDRADHAFMAAAELPKVADQAAKLTSGTLAMEGFDSVPLWAWGEQPVTYEALAQATDQRISVPNLYNDWGGFSFFETRLPGNPVYTTAYSDVVSRFAGMTTPRKVLYRQGPYAIAERAHPFDVIVARGISADNRSHDASGSAFIQAQAAQMGFEQGPPTFWISAESPAPAYLRMRLHTTLPVTTAKSVRGAVTTPIPGGREICAPVTGTGPGRIFELPITPQPGPITFTTDNRDNAPFVNRDIQVVGLGASTEPCA